MLRTPLSDAPQTKGVVTRHEAEAGIVLSGNTGQTETAFDLGNLRGCEMIIFA